MKKLGTFLLGIWCLFTSIFTLPWLFLIFLNVSGLIYKYDSTMDEGTAVILGMFGAVIWVIFALLPDIVFIKTLKNNGILF